MHSTLIRRSSGNTAEAAPQRAGHGLLTLLAAGLCWILSIGPAMADSEERVLLGPIQTSASDDHGVDAIHDDSPSRRLQIHRPGHYSNDVLSVFKMKVEDLIPFDLGRAFSGELFEAYVMGGQSSVRIRRSNSFGQAIPGEGRSVALHLGGGTDLHINHNWVLSFDFGEVVHSGGLSGLSYEAYQLSFRYSF
jgi:hypothetical protein